MIVVGRRVLIEQIMTKKKSVIILPGKSSPEDQYDISFKILQLGKDCPKDEMEIGDIPIFTKHVNFEGAKVIEEEKDVRMVLHTIVYYDDIICIDNPSSSEDNLVKITK